LGLSESWRPPVFSSSLCCFLTAQHPAGNKERHDTDNEETTAANTKLVHSCSPHQIVYLSARICSEVYSSDWP
jgi:cytochrome b involved in lipid metabolism